MKALSQKQREIMLLLRGELDQGDEYADLALACDALSRMFAGDDVVQAYNLTCEFLRYEDSVWH